MSTGPKSLTPSQAAVVGAFEELDSAVKSVVKNFGRMAMVVDQLMSEQAGLPTRKLSVVPDDSIPASHTDADIIAAAEKALAQPPPMPTDATPVPA
jgi:hypothetical protein